MAESKKNIDVTCILESALGNETTNAISLQMNHTILFQGDSITDSDRDRSDNMPNNISSLGKGFVFDIYKYLDQARQHYNLSIYNRGISGNKTSELLARWPEDCVALKPDILNILVGVNDYWHKRGKNNNQSLQEYSDSYERLIDITKQRLPKTHIVVCEPFILSNTSVVNDSWLEPFSKYRTVAETLAKRNNLTWVPLQKIFNKAVKYAPETYWLLDGVHPTNAGVDLISQSWLHFVFKDKVRDVFQ